MKEGYIKLYRGLEDNPLWTFDVFSKAQAWIDLLLLTNHKTGHIKLRNGEIVQINRGECGWSMESLAKRWQWSRGKVKRFFDYLKNEKMIQQTDISNATVIKVLNYERFQNDTTNGQQTVQQTDTNKNGKKESLLHKLSKEKIFENLSVEWWELLKEWSDYKTAKKQAYKNERSWRAFINKLLKLSGKDLLKAQDIIEESMANNWSGIFETKTPQKPVSLKVIPRGMNYTPDEPILEKNKRIRETSSEMPQEFKDFKTKLKGIVYDTRGESA